MLYKTMDEVYIDVSSIWMLLTQGVIDFNVASAERTIKCQKESATVKVNGKRQLARKQHTNGRNNART